MEVDYPVEVVSVKVHGDPNSELFLSKLELLNARVRIALLEDTLAELLDEFTSKLFDICPAKNMSEAERIVSEDPLVQKVQRLLNK